MNSEDMIRGQAQALTEGSRREASHTRQGISSDHRTGAATGVHAASFEQRLDGLQQFGSNQGAVEVTRVAS